MMHFLRGSRAARWGALLFAGSVALACGVEPGAKDVSQAQVLASADDAHAPLLLDVRTPGEFTAGHVPGAVNIPHDVLEQRLGEISGRRDSEVVVYCEQGGRAAKAEAVLAGAGFTRVKHLTGDMAAWREAGLPVAK